MNTQIKNFIVTGCSFTAGTSDLKMAKENPRTWPHFLLPFLNPELFVNLAIPGAGNFSIANGLTYFLETKKYIDPTNTLIGINFTGLDRIDTMCAVDHPNANRCFSWANDLGFNWITDSNFTQKVQPFNGLLQKNIGLEQVRTLNCLSIIQVLSYLESNNFNYFFMLMNNYILTDSPDWFKTFLNQRRSKWLTFDQYQTVYEFVDANKLTDKDGFHPSLNGYKLIAQTIASTLEYV